jgi:hypothetical protein
MRLVVWAGGAKPRLRPTTSHLPPSAHVLRTAHRGEGGIAHGNRRPVCVPLV